MSCARDTISCARDNFFFLHVLSQPPYLPHRFLASFHSLNMHSTAIVLEPDDIFMFCLSFNPRVGVDHSGHCESVYQCIINSEILGGVMIMLILQSYP